jgi:DNA replication ATP-dependent helicase Dna2
MCFCPLRLSCRVADVQDVAEGSAPPLGPDVERFQGQQRDVIIASFALGDPDAIGDEDEFLMSLKRFNVMASRARAKLIVFVSREVVDHLSAELDTLRESKLLKVFVESFWSSYRPMTLGCLDDGSLQPRPGEFRFCR